HPEHRPLGIAQLPLPLPPRALAHSGMFPCFLGGSVSRLVRRIRSACTTYRRGYDGGVTESTYPRSGATYGWARVSSYSVASRTRSTSGSSAAPSSRRYRMLTAPCAPITAIWAVGQATLMSARRCLEPMTSYAPPYALRVITVT